MNNELKYWFDNVPQHWQIKRLKDLINIKSGDAIDKEDIETLGRYPVFGGGKSIGYYNEYNISEYDIIVGRVGAKCGCVTFPQRKSWATDNALVVSNRFKNKYLYYLLIQCNLNTLSNTVAQPLITSSQIKNIFIALPPLAEQIKITSYLDEKISDINAFIATREKELLLLQNLKKARIVEVISKGLSPNAPLKDSGIPSIGLIPAHWDVRRLKDIGFLYSGLTGKSGDDFRNEDEETTKPYVTFTNILNHQYVDFSQFKSVVIFDNENQNRVCENDLLFLMSSEDYESIAKTAVVVGDPGEVYLNSFCKGFRILYKNIYAPFLCYELSSDNYRNALRFEAQGFTRINIKTGKIASSFISLPPFEEQREIASYLDHECEEIEKKCALIDKQIQQLQLLKRALINEVVTGKKAI